MNIEQKLDKILLTVERIEKNQRAGAIIEGKKTKQKRSFESSKHFECLKHWPESFEPTSNSNDFLTVTQVYEIIKEHNAYEVPLSVVGVFLNYYFKENQVMKAAKGGSVMYKCYKIRLV